LLFGFWKHAQPLPGLQGPARWRLKGASARPHDSQRADACKGISVAGLRWLAYGSRLRRGRLIDCSHGRADARAGACHRSRRACSRRSRWRSGWRSRACLSDKNHASRSALPAAALPAPQRLTPCLSHATAASLGEYLCSGGVTLRSCGGKTPQRLQGDSWVAHVMVSPLPPEGPDDRHTGDRERHNAQRPARGAPVRHGWTLGSSVGAVHCGGVSGPVRVCGLPASDSVQAVRSMPYLVMRTGCQRTSTREGGHVSAGHVHYPAHQVGTTTVASPSGSDQRRLP
jgi:hypothetical protein